MTTSSYPQFSAQCHPSDSKSAYDFNLEEKHIEECIEWAKYLAIRVMDMDQDLADEAKNFREFGKWLKHGEFAKLQGNRGHTDHIILL